MSELSNSIKKCLGIRIAESQLNHYTLLGIDRKASPGEIKQAIRTAVAAWNASDTKSDPEAARVVAKLIKQAQAALLDASSKQEYDEQLSLQESCANHSFFPQSDPFAPFDPKACLALAGSSSSIYSFGSPNDRWNELRRQIPTLADAPPVAHTFPVAHTSPVAQTPPVQVDCPHEPASLERGAALINKFERLKRVRKRKQGLYVAGFLAVAAAFLGYAGFRFVWNRLQVAKRLETAAEIAGPETTLNRSKSLNVRSIGGKNAPKSKGSDPTFVFPKLAKEEVSSEAGLEPQDPKAMPPMPMQPASDKPMASPAAGAARADWIEAMIKAKESIHSSDFGAFHKQMELALPLSTTDEMQAKHARLDQLGQLYEIFIKSLRDAKSKMRGGDTLSVGKLMIGIVEINDDELVVRIEGKNERYAWDRLPPGIAIAMADLSLGEKEPTDLAAKAVYFSLSPTRNQLFEKKVTDWFEKSVGKGTIRKDLVQALTDTYD